MIFALLIVTAALVAVVLIGARERAAWTLERADLLQRIQAPDRAVTQHAVKALTPDVPAVPFDNDDEFWKTKEAA